MNTLSERNSFVCRGLTIVFPMRSGISCFTDKDIKGIKSKVPLLRRGPGPRSSGSLPVPLKCCLLLPSTPNSRQADEMEGNKSGQFNSQNGKGLPLHCPGKQSLRA